MLPPEERLPQIRDLIDDKHYFVIHALRKIGKTTLLRNLSRKLTAEGKYAALTISVESFMAGEPGEVMPQILQGISWASEYALPDHLQPPDVGKFAGNPLVAFQRYLSAWSAAIDRPLVLFLDEADSVAGPVCPDLASAPAAGRLYGASQALSPKRSPGRTQGRTGLQGADGGRHGHPGNRQPIQHKGSIPVYRLFYASGNCGVAPAAPGRNGAGIYG